MLIAGIALLSCHRGTLGYSYVMGTNVTFSTPSGDAAGYLATPESGSGPGVIVVQEWWGLDSGIIDISDDLARNGFVALAPDLYHGELAGHTEMDKAGELMTSLPMDRAAQDMSGAVDYLVAHESTSSSTLAVMGFCMGGMLTFVLAALRPDAISAAVPFYGFPSGDDQPDYSNITAKIRGHMAEVDGFFPPEGAADLEHACRRQESTQPSPCTRAPAMHSWHHIMRSGLKTTISPHGCGQKFTRLSAIPCHSA